ncbi:MAG TPA: histidine kinase [Candidatus Limnocylindrales bacterium]|nr:histidine kinase [Candidatus Limnocylindrales bacterium]
MSRRTDRGTLADVKESVDRALDDLALAVLEAQERERARLADELHDGPAQALSNLIMQCEIIERQLRDAPGLAVEELHRLREMLRGELDMLRGYIYQLRPPLSESDDLNTALAEAAARLAEGAGLNVDVRLEASSEMLERPARSAVLRVAQEALRNIGKHSEAGRAWLHTRVEPGPRGQDQWVLEVGDDGRGFEAQEIDRRARRRHFGLRFMRERSELLGAHLTIDSSPGGGTVIRLVANSSGSGR